MPYYALVRFIARTVALAVTKGDAQLLGQHICGRHNNVADALSYSGLDRGKANELTWDSPNNDTLT